MLISSEESLRQLEWEQEQQRAREQQEEPIKEFGYGFIVQSLDNIIDQLSNKDIINAYVHLGMLRQHIVLSEEFINEE